MSNVYGLGRPNPGPHHVPGFMITGDDVVVKEVKAPDITVPGSGKLTLLVTNAGCIGKRWPLLAYYEGLWYEWDTNEPMTGGLSNYYGHASYKSMDLGTFIDVDMRQVLQPNSSSEYK